MRKLYQTLENEGEFANVRSKNEYGEYTVMLYPRDLSQKPFVTYHTNDLQDACNTANLIVFPPRKRPARDRMLIAMKAIDAAIQKELA